LASIACDESEMIENRSRSAYERMPRGTRGRRELKAEAKASRRSGTVEQEGIGDTVSHRVMSSLVVCNPTRHTMLKRDLHIGNVHPYGCAIGV
jgi:hypothetical protein